MPDSRHRVLAVASHPVQYAAPLFRLMAQHPQMEFQVVYCSLRGAEAGVDPGFGTTVKWDIPLLEGYCWTQVPNRGSGKESFLGLRNPGLRKLILDGKFDAVLCYLGYVRASFWIAYRAARASGAAFLFGTDTASLASRDGGEWKAGLKKVLWPRLFRLADQVLVPSSATREVMLSLGVEAEKIALTPYAVDNDWWSRQAEQAERAAVRAQWGASESNFVILFCAKLQEWKRPGDLLRAVASLKSREVRVVFAGDGPLRPALERQGKALKIEDRVKILGFVNQSELPGIYVAADLMVLPSEYEPFGLVVNEAMLCGCPVLASEHVGAVRDLIEAGKTGFVYRTGDIEKLTRALEEIIADRKNLAEVACRARSRMETWSYREAVDGTVDGIARAIRRRRR